MKKLMLLCATLFAMAFAVPATPAQVKRKSLALARNDVNDP